MSADRPRVAVVGVGLIGGSLGMALRRRGLAEVAGLGRNEGRLELARECGAVDVTSTDPADVVPGAEHVVVCTPVSTMGAMFESVAPHLSAGTVVSDAGSTKVAVMRQARGHLPDGVAFAGAHPMAGSDRSGVAAASADLFEGAVCIVVEGGSSEAAEGVSDLWRSVGCRVSRMSAEEHDRLVALSSHLPHVCAAALVRAVTSVDGAVELTAGGFADTTRIAASSPGMWTDICLANADEVAAAVKAYIDRLDEFADLLAAGDPDAVLRFFASAREARDRLEQRK